MSKQDSFKEAIKSYLDERAGIDELFAKSYAKKNKSLDECCNYILGEAKKRGNAVAISDAEVFGMAVHYYDEDDIKVDRMPTNVRAVVSNPAKQPQEANLKENKSASRKSKSHSTPLSNEDTPKVLQLSLF